MCPLPRLASKAKQKPINQYIQHYCCGQDAALDIDHTCHNIHNNTADIQLHGGIERQNGGLSEQGVWERSSDKNVQEAQSKL